VIEFSEAIAELAKALPAAQHAIAKVTRDATNPHFNSKYATLTEIAEAVLPALNEAGFSVLQPVTTSPGAVEVTTILLHASGQWLRATHLIPVTKNDAQGVGSALTYARRQALQSLLTVAPAGEDDDAEAAVGGQRPPLPQSEPKRPDRSQRVKRLEQTLGEVTTKTDLDRAWKLAAGLRAELAAEDVSTASRLDRMYERLAAKLGEPTTADGEVAP
jgi:ERF superfamily